jgi:hypothetical protein
VQALKQPEDALGMPLFEPNAVIGNANDPLVAGMLRRYTNARPLGWPSILDRV